MATATAPVSVIVTVGVTRASAVRGNVVAYANRHSKGLTDGYAKGFEEGVTYAAHVMLGDTTTIE